MQTPQFEHATQILPQNLCFLAKTDSRLEAEIVDLLQGRVPKSVFVRHYLTPNLSYRDDVLHAVMKLKQEIKK